MNAASIPEKKFQTKRKWRKLLSDEAVTKFKYLEVTRKNVTSSFAETGRLGKDKFFVLLLKSRIRYIIYYVAARYALQRVAQCVSWVALRWTRS